jgi:hypothetical protein
LKWYCRMVPVAIVWQIPMRLNLILVVPEFWTGWRLPYARHLRVMAYFCYFEPLITQQMEASGSSEGWKVMRKKIDYHPI